MPVACRRLSGTAGTLVGAFVVAFGAHAEVVKCPPPGTVVTRPAGSVTYHGATPDHPWTCKVTTMRNKEDASVFNVYSPNTKEIREMAATLAPVFTGQAAYASVEYSSPTSGYKFRDAWRNLQSKDSVTVDGKRREADLFELHRENLNNPGSFRFNGKWKLWRDTESGIWSKSEFTAVTPGSSAENMFTPALSIKAP